MVKHLPTLIILLIFSAAFVSCERAPQVLPPMPPEEMDPVKDSSAVVINELMADNDGVYADPQGDFDDWVELYNTTDTAVDLSGMYLSDKDDNHTKWQFPDGTVIAANGYLIVWCDEDHDDPAATEGLHSNFKLSKSGELVLLVDTDAQGNTVLDSVTFGEQDTDVAYGRLPNGTGKFQVVAATPSEANKAQ